MKDDDSHLSVLPAPSRRPTTASSTHPKTEQFQMAMPVGHPLQRPEDLAAYRFPTAYRDDTFLQLEEWRKNLSDRFSMVMLGGTLFEMAWALRGMEELMLDMAERPEFVEELLDRITAHRLEHIHQALRLTDFDGVWFGDDFGMQTGVLMGEGYWRHFIKPRLRRLFEPVRNAGKYVYLHSCGKVQDDSGRPGGDRPEHLQPLPARGHGTCSISCGATTAGWRSTAAWGVQSTLPHGTPVEVRAMTQRLIEAGRHGGFVISPSHTIGPDVPRANVDAMLEVLRGQPGLLPTVRVRGVATR